MKDTTSQNTAERSPPYSMPEALTVSAVKTQLLAVLAAHRALAKAIDTLGDVWASDLATRNRSNRQKLTTRLIEQLPKPLAFGSVVDAIAAECDIDL